MESTRSVSLFDLYDFHLKTEIFKSRIFLGVKVKGLPKDYLGEADRAESCLMVFHTTWKLSTLAWFGLAHFLFLSFSYTGRNCTSTPCIRVRRTFSVPAPGSCSTCCWTRRPRAPWFPAWARTWMSYINGFHFTLIIANRRQWFMKFY